MRLFIRIIFALALALPVTAPRVGLAADDAPRMAFCVQPPHDALCPVFPDGQVAFRRSFEYVGLQKAAQDPFDVFPWWAFIALNWPMTGDRPQARIGDATAPPTRILRCWNIFDSTAAGTRTAAGTPSNFTFLLSDVQ